MGVTLLSKSNKDHWFDAGMAILVAQGPDSLSVAQLCEQVGRTKGSFYHHFKDHQQYVDELINNWQQQNLYRPMKESTAGSGRARLSLLTVLAAELNPEQEMAVRRLASRNDRVRAALALVDNARMEYLALLYREAGLTSRQATNAASIQYAGFVGAQNLWPQEFGDRVRKLGKVVDEMLMAGTDANATGN